jgi:hypothetical protein
MCFLLSRLLGKNGELLGSYGCFCIVVTKATHKTKPTTCLCELHRIGCAWHSHDQPPQSFTHFNFDFRRHHLIYPEKATAILRACSAASGLGGVCVAAAAATPAVAAEPTVTSAAMSSVAIGAAGRPWLNSHTTRGQITLAPATFFALALLCSGYPLGLVPVVSVTGRTLQSLLRGIHHQIPLAVLLCEPNGIEGDGYVFFAYPEEPAHP